MGRNNLWLAGVAVSSFTAVAAPKTVLHSGPSQPEATLKALSWASIGATVDAERSVTLHEWRKKYAADRKTKAGAFVALHSLAAERQLDLSGVDRCMAEKGETTISFGDMLGRSIEVAAVSRIIATNPTIDDEKVYHLTPQRVAVGLRSHPFCVNETPEQVSQEFSHSFDAKVKPDTALAKQLDDYMWQGNQLLNQVNFAQTSTAYDIAMSEFKAYQGVMMSCLAYTESLGDTESASGSEIFSNLQKRSYVSRSKRPPGVALGVDRPADYYVGNRSRREQIDLGMPESLGTYVDDKGRSRARYFSYTDELKVALADAVTTDHPDSLTKAQVEQKRTAIMKSFVKKRLTEYRADLAAGMSGTALHAKYFSSVSQMSWVSTGVFQFKFANLDTEKGDELSSNIGPCVDQWNALYGNSCPIKHSIGGYAEALTSSGQAFNMFCGVQKIVQSYNTQVHTLNPKKTSPQNLGPDGKLLPPAKRCVHPFWQGSLGYNHFGPLANSAPAGSIAGLPSYPGNLKLLMECIHNNGRTIFRGR